MPAVFAPGWALAQATHIWEALRTESRKPGTARLGAIGGLPVHGGMETTKMVKPWTRMPSLHPEVYCLLPALLSQVKRSWSPALSCSGCAALAARAPFPKGSSWLEWENPFPCIWKLQIGPIACQKLAVGDCANSCTRRQNYALQSGFYKIWHFNSPEHLTLWLEKGSKRTSNILCVVYVKCGNRILKTINFPLLHEYLTCAGVVQVNKLWANNCPYV